MEIGPRKKFAFIAGFTAFVLAGVEISIAQQFSSPVDYSVKKKSINQSVDKFDGNNAVKEGNAAEVVRDQTSRKVDETILPDRAAYPQVETEEYISDAPDERVLWKLYNNKKYEQVREVIQQWQKRFVGWVAPKSLTDYLADRDKEKIQQAQEKKRAARDEKRKARQLRVARREKEKRKQLGKAFLSEDPARIMKESFKSNELFACRQLDNIWALLPIYHFTHNQQQTFDVLKGVLDAKGCNTEKTSFYVLQVAQNYLDVHYYDQLFAYAEPRFIDPKLILKLKTIRYQHHGLYLVRAIDDGQQLSVIEDMAESLHQEIIGRQDGLLARVVAWYFFEHQRYLLAEHWFELAQNFAKQDIEMFADAEYGRALSLQKQGREQELVELVSNNLSKNPKLSVIHHQIVFDKINKLYGDGNLKEALLLAEEHGDIGPEIDQLVLEILVAKAWQYYELKELSQSRELATKAKEMPGHDRSAEIILAWLDYAQEDYEKALQRFEQLYQEEPENSLALGIVYCRVAMNASHQQLEQLASEKGGDFAWEVGLVISRDLFYKKEFLASAYHSNKIQSSGHSPEQVVALPKQQRQKDNSSVGVQSNMAQKAPQIAREFKGTKVGSRNLTNIDSSFVETDLLHRIKKGDDGTTALRTTYFPNLKGRYVYKGVHEFSAYGQQVSLESGLLNPWLTEVGSAGVYQGGNRSLANPPDVKLSDAYALQLHYQKSGWYHPFFSLGLTPVNGVIDPGFTWQAGVKKHTSEGSWKIKLYREPVRESILSFTGMKDPYSNQEWGRVLKTGGQGTLVYQLSPQWGLYSMLGSAWLDGENVDDNWMVQASASLGYTLNCKGFDYFTVGPAVNFLHYDENRSHFTLGHGGYFSPDMYSNLGVTFDFLTDEGESFIAKGHVGVGYQSIDNVAAELFPGQAGLANQTILQTGGGSISQYAADSSHGESFDFEFVGSWLLAPHWQLSSGLSYRKTNGYQDYSVGLGMRFYFRPREVVFSTDIPDQLFGLLH